MFQIICVLFYSTEKRNDFLQVVKRKGAVMAGCGTHSIRLRPPLICTQKHTRQWEEILLKTLGEMFKR